MKHTHLTDDQLIATCVSSPASPFIEDCTACRERRSVLTGLLDEMADVAFMQADAAFPPERRARQQARILQRLDNDARPGRVIVFPLAQAKPASLLRPTPIRRWVAGAAAAGLLIGMAAGHFVHELPALREPAAAPQQVVLTRSPVLPRRAASTVSDDEFLREIEYAVSSSGPAALRRIDALTPVAWEVP